MSKHRFAPRLKVGERIRFDDGSEWRVTHVSPGSATCKCIVASPEAIVEREVVFERDSKGNVLDEPKHATLKGVRSGAYPVGKHLEISLTSFVERVFEAA